MGETSGNKTQETYITLEVIKRQYQAYLEHLRTTADDTVVSLYYKAINSLPPCIPIDRRNGIIASLGLQTEDVETINGFVSISAFQCAWQAVNGNWAKRNFNITSTGNLLFALGLPKQETAHSFQTAEKLFRTELKNTTVRQRARYP
jgi:hypothetical protein